MIRVRIDQNPVPGLGHAQQSNGRTLALEGARTVQHEDGLPSFPTCLPYHCTLFIALSA